jgi:hypothetical protein
MNENDLLEKKETREKFIEVVAPHPRDFSHELGATYVE